MRIPCFAYGLSLVVQELTFCYMLELTSSGYAEAQAELKGRM